MANLSSGEYRQGQHTYPNVGMTGNAASVSQISGKHRRSQSRHCFIEKRTPRRASRDSVQRVPNGQLRALFFRIGICLLFVQPGACLRKACDEADIGCNPLNLLLYTTPICEQGYAQVIQSRQSGLFLNYLRASRAQGSSSSPVANTTTLTGLGSTGNDWSGGVYRPGGSVFLIPGNNTGIPIINSASNTVNTSALGGVVAGGTNQWFGGVLHPNGNIYGIDFIDSTMLEIDPVTNAITRYAIAGGAQNWAGGTLARNGKIYGVPSVGTDVLIWDPVAQTTTKITGVGTGGNDWTGGVLAPNGKIYGIPRDSQSVLIIDPATDTVDTTTISGLPATAAKYLGGVLSPDGRIYAIPFAESAVMIIDPQTNTIDTTTLAGVGSAGNDWQGGVLGPDGKIYGIPYNNTSVLIIDTLTNTADTTTLAGVGTASADWRGGVLGLNGRIYGVPRGNANVLIIETNANASFCDAVLASAYLNKF